MMHIDKVNIDLDTLNGVSEHLKKDISSSLGIKMDSHESTITMKLSNVDEDGNPELEFRKVNLGLEYFRNYLSDNGKDFIVGICFIVFTFFNLLEVLGFFKAYSTMNIAYTDFNKIIWDVALPIIPMIIWAFSTNHPVFNFRNRKVLMFYLSYFFINFLMVRLTFIISYRITVPYISQIEPTAQMSVDKIVGLAYIATFIPLAFAVFILILISVRGTVFNKDFIDRLEAFRLFKVFDLEIYSKFEYTHQVVREIKSGSKITIPQKDRQAHTAIIGATGTAKTSSVLLPGILKDLKVRIRNKNALKKLFKHYTEIGMFRIKRTFSDDDFSTKHFEPNPDYKRTFRDKITGRTPKRVYEFLNSKYEIAGQTILVPEESLADDAYNLFEAYGEKANRVDPKLIDGMHKPGFKGLNILYISPNMPSWAVDREKVRRATLLADVMQIMFEMGGKSDPYFASVNRIATTTIALLLQLTYPQMYNRQPNLEDVQNCINDFTKLYEPYSVLFPNGKVSEANKKYLWLKDNISNFFIGEGSETFEQHARGLKVQISLFLADDYIRQLVTADEVIDFDEILSNNELTVVNIELPEIGPINAPALGLFFSVNMTNAVLRRPGTEWTRTFHVWRIDEFPIIVTPSMEQAFTLFRKFKVAMEVALQTLDQMDKTPYLKYLKGVILNSTANQIVFGRANISEMDIYSILSGTIDDIVEMEGTSETSLFSENPSMSTMRRKTKQITNVSEKSDIRNKDFQEVTYFYTKRGSLMPPVHGKVDFVSKNDKKGRNKQIKVDWSKLFDGSSKDTIESLPNKKAVLKFNEEQLNEARKRGDMVSEVIMVDSQKAKIESVIEVQEPTPFEIEIENVVAKEKPDTVISTNDYTQANTEEPSRTEQPPKPIDSKEARENQRKKMTDFF
ncbi:MAG: hypothetical protein IBX70_07630 [Clostridia bacterium]|nr:hypothetical protein [Clostridia bacterium]